MSRLRESHSSAHGFVNGDRSVLALPRRILARFRARREMNRLLSMDDHMLQDIGLSRGDIQREAMRSLW
ncbi:MAG TPA: DUF1127 domain-containing protein [Aestuariivirga sp.]|nr:DUF1127 domain-containing protein [Aestuariivirga sp.]